MALSDLPHEVILEIGQYLSVDDVFTLRRMLLPPDLESFKANDVLKAAFVERELWCNYNSARLDLRSFKGSLDQEFLQREASYWQHKAGYPCKRIGQNRDPRYKQYWLLVRDPCGSTVRAIEKPRSGTDEQLGEEYLELYDLARDKRTPITPPGGQRQYLPHSVHTRTLFAFVETHPNVLYVQSLDALPSTAESINFETSDSVRMHTLENGLFVESTSGYNDRLVLLLGHTKTIWVSVYDYSSDRLHEQAEPLDISEGSHHVTAYAKYFEIFTNSGRSKRPTLTVSRYDYDLNRLDRWQIRVEMERTCWYSVIVYPTGNTDMVQVRFSEFDCNVRILVVLDTKERRIVAQLTGEEQFIWRDRLYRLEDSQVKVIALLPDMVEHRVIGNIRHSCKVTDVYVDDSFMILSHESDGLEGWTAFTFDPSIDTGYGELPNQRAQWYWQGVRRSLRLKRTLEA